MHSKGWFFCFAQSAMGKVESSMYDVCFRASWKSEDFLQFDSVFEHVGKVRILFDSIYISHESSLVESEWSLAFQSNLSVYLNQILHEGGGGDAQWKKLL